MIDFFLVVSCLFGMSMCMHSLRAVVRWVIDPWYQLTPTLSTMLSASHTPARVDRCVTDTALEQLLFMLG